MRIRQTLIRSNYLIQARYRRYLANAVSSKDNDRTLQFDFFGEPVTFHGSLGSFDHLSYAMAAHDAFQLAVVSKGKSCSGGSDDAGLQIKSAHSVAIAWADAIKHAASWNNPVVYAKNTAAPMLSVPVVAPLLAHAGTAYVKHLDSFLHHAQVPVPDLDHISLIELATIATNDISDSKMDQRETLHLEALKFLLRDSSKRALSVYLRILRLCPGDALAMSLAMDLAHKLSDSSVALQISGSVAAYWKERQGGLITPAIPGHKMATGLMAVGLAAGYYAEDAERMIEVSMKQAKKSSGALGSWAKALLYDSTGRVSEGISALANTDGFDLFEGSGLFFFERRLAGYGARFAIDREERGRGKSQALRLYESYFEQVLEYSGFAVGNPWSLPQERAPGKSLLVSGQSTLPKKMDDWRPTIDDVLTWMPPTIPFLTDATLLLLRFTLNGTISTKNIRWESLANAWRIMLNIQRKQGQELRSNGPLACLAMSFFIDPRECGGDTVGNGKIAQALNMVGQQLKLGTIDQGNSSEKTVRESVAEIAPTFWLPDATQQAIWKEIVDLMVEGIEGIDAELGDEVKEFRLWDFDARPISEHLLTYAACKAGDVESLSVARAVCSQAVTLRPNSPETWWRYSIVLGLLGDIVGSENALNQSINVGAGQGAR